MGVVRHSRKDASAATEYLVGLQLDVDPLRGWTGSDRPSSPGVFLHGFQAQPLKVARQVSAAGWYPDDGVGTGTTAASASSGQADVKLAANVLQSQHATLTPVGMLLAGQYNSGSNLWEVGQITAWNAGTQTVTLGANLTNTWGSGTKYHLLYALDLAEYTHIGSEFSVSGAEATVTPYLFPWIADGGVLSRDADIDVTLPATSLMGAASEVRETSYYYGRVRTRQTRGYMALKLRVVSVSSGFVSIWLARS